MKEVSPNDFPRRLREITDPPKKLYVQGVLPPEDHKWLSVVGSRKYTNYGKEAVEKLITGLSGYPVVIVSGLALGIDAIAADIGKIFGHAFEYFGEGRHRIAGEETATGRDHRLGQRLRAFEQFDGHAASSSSPSWTGSSYFQTWKTKSGQICAQA